MNTNKDIKVIRALWGNSKTILTEIPDKPLYDEVVYVWGLDNFNLLSQRGYKVQLMDTYHTPFASKYHTFFTKLTVFKKAVETYSKVLFLDWDCNQVKPLDKKFWKWFEGKTYAAPLYCYPKNMQKYLSGMTEEQYKWMNMQIPMLEKYSWSYKNFHVIPNACMVFLSDINLCLEMIKQYRKYNMSTVEEFAMYTALDCSLNYYLDNYEVPFVFGRPDDNYFSLGELQGHFSRQFNSYISSKVNKDVYFTHI